MINPDNYIFNSVSYNHLFDNYIVLIAVSGGDKKARSSSESNKMSNTIKTKLQILSVMMKMKF